MAFKEEARRFLRSTSMKGVPRIMNSDSQGLTLAWLLTVLVLCGLATYQVTTLLVAYFEYKIVTVVTEKTVKPESNKALDIVLPTPTVCSLSPVPRRKLNSIPKHYSLTAFYDKVMNETTCPSCSEREKIKLLDIQSRLLSPSGYFQFIGPESAEEYGHDLEDFLVDCSLLAYTAIDEHLIPCGDLVTIKKQNNPDFFNCFEISLNHEPYFPNVIIGFVLTFYLDDFVINSTTGYEHYNPHTYTGYESGVSVAFHNAFEAQQIPQTGYSNHFQSISVPPGHAGTVQLQRTDRSRLPPPHGTCDEGVDPGMNNQIFCMNLCFLEVVRDHCGCAPVLAGYPSGVITINGTIPFCFDIKISIAHILNFTKCQFDISEDIQKCFRGCRNGCFEHTFSFTPFLSQWPAQIHNRGAYTKFIRHRLTDTTTRAFLDRAFLTPLTASAEERLVAQMYVERNVVRVKLQLASQIYTLLADEKKITMTDVLSSLGGTLNLWTGITVYVLVELVEFVLRLMTSLMCGPGVMIGTQRTVPVKEGTHK